MWGGCQCIKWRNQYGPTALHNTLHGLLDRGNQQIEFEALTPCLDDEFCIAIR